MPKQSVRCYIAPLCTAINFSDSDLSLQRANKGPSSVRLKEAQKDRIFLDDIVITFVDGGSTGLGDTSYTTLLSYSIYTVSSLLMQLVFYRFAV